MPGKTIHFHPSLVTSLLRFRYWEGAGPKFIIFWLSFACTAKSPILNTRTQVHFTPLRVVQAWLSALMKNHCVKTKLRLSLCEIKLDIYDAKETIHLPPSLFTSLLRTDTGRGGGP